MYILLVSIIKDHRLRGLKQQIYSFAVLEAVNSKSMCEQGYVPSETGQNPSLPSPRLGWWLLILGIPWFAALSLQSFPSLSHGILFLCLHMVSYCYKDSSHWISLPQASPLFDYIYKDYFQIRSNLQVPGIGTSTISLRDTYTHGLLGSNQKHTVRCTRALSTQ